MRALLCKEFGPPEDLVLGELDVPEPSEGEVRITVYAAGVNFPDFLIIQDKYQFKPERPFAPGGEFAGIISAVGPGVTAFKVGDKVMASAVHGAFAEEVLAETTKCFHVPDAIDHDVAASLNIVYGTSYHALFDRGAMQAGETVLVLGAAGGVGLATVELAKAGGATVIAAASSEEKLAVCRAHGADLLLNYSEGDFRAKLKELCPTGPDVIYDPVGGELSELAFRSIGWRGRHLVIGFAAGDIPKIPLNLALLKQASLVGVLWGAYTRKEPEAYAQDMKTLMDWVIDGRIKPRVSGHYALAEGGAAIRHIADRKAVGKLVIEPLK
ncbi:MAG: NADPH:quinone oxidoreductase family protein [Pseudomonadota bacterium]